MEVQNILRYFTPEILELIPDAVVMSNSHGAIKYVNSRTLEMFGYDREKLLENEIEILVPEEFREKHKQYRYHYIENPSQRNMSIKRELYGRREDGTTLPIEISLGPVNVNDSLYIISIIRNTSTRNLIRVLEERNKEMEQFAYVASHDLREPLLTLKGFTELLDKEYSHSFDDKGRSFLNHIILASTRMQELVKGILEYSRLGNNPNLEYVDLMCLVEDVKADLHTFISKTQSCIEVCCLPKVRGYKIELRLLFQNLISNAIKFSVKKNRPIIKIRSKQLDQNWLISIEDNGIGIDESSQQKIFEMFQRLHNKADYEGTGIGLAHCNKIVELHGGKIWVDSTPGMGSVFHILLPI